MKRYVLAVLIVLFVMTGQTSAYDSGALKFSELFRNSDAVVSVRVIAVVDQLNAYTMTVKINEVMYGNFGEARVTLTTRKSNGFFIPDLSYLQKEEEYIIFIKRENSVWAFTGFNDANFPVSYRDDFEMLVNRFTGNRKIFSTSNSRNLIGLYNAVQNERVKDVILNDLKNTLVEDDTEFMNSLMNSGRKNHRLFGISMLGRHRVAARTGAIENLLAVEADDDIKIQCIVSLGDIGNKNSSIHLIPLLKSQKQAIRRSAIEALGKINDAENVSHIEAGYGTETDIGNRLAIIDAIANSSDKNIVRDAYTAFKKLEKERFIIEYLDRKLTKLKN